MSDERGEERKGEEIEICLNPYVQFSTSLYNITLVVKGNTNFAIDIFLKYKNDLNIPPSSSEERREKKRRREKEEEKRRSV